MKFLSFLILTLTITTTAAFADVKFFKGSAEPLTPMCHYTNAYDVAADNAMLKAIKKGFNESDCEVVGKKQKDSILMGLQCVVTLRCEK